MHHPTRLLPCLIACLVALLPVMAHGAFNVDLPKGWTEYALPAEARLKTREFESTGGLLDISIAGLAGNAIKSAADLPAALTSLSSKMGSLPLAEHREVAVKKGRVEFLYSTFEDQKSKGKKLEPGKFHFVTRVVGIFEGRVIFVASLFTNAADGSDVTQGLQIIESLSINDNDAIEGPSHAVVCDKLGARIVFPPEVPLSRDGKTDAQNHFQIQYPGTSVVASGWFDSAKAFKGFKPFWEAEKKKLSMVMPVKDETFETISGWTVVFYSVEMGPVVQQNARACRIEKGVWLDLHLSSVGGPERRELLKRVLTQTTAGEN